jgi:hypothetical protein
MDAAGRHHCLIYEGPPSRHLPALSAAIQEKLQQNYRCLYLNSPQMVAGMRSYLAANGVDVFDATAKGSLVLSAEQHHLRDGRFDIEGMLHDLEQAIDQALVDGYKGLWATGDMTWELGPEKDFAKLLEYEWQLEEFIQKHPEFGGVCQYHADTLPREAMHHGLLAHPSVFINETLSLINPHYVERRSFTPQAEKSPEVESVVSRLLQLEFSI